MARRKRRSKKQITYDSKETKTIFGLLSLLAAFTFAIASIIEPNEGNLFTEIRGIFGQSTIIWALFLFNLGLMLFDSKLPFATRSSIVSQFILALLTPAFLTSLYRLKPEAIIATEQGLAGGELGYFLSYQLFSDTLVFAQYTPLILGLAILIFVPLAFSMSVSKLVEYLSKFFSWLWKALNVLISEAKTKSNNEKTAIKNEKDDTTEATPEKAKRFGDFQKRRQTGVDTEPATNSNKSPENQKSAEEQPVTPKQASLEKVSEDSNIEIKEKELGEAGLASKDSLVFPNWQLPPLSLLSPYDKIKHEDKDTKENAKIIEETLSSFNIDAEVVDTFVGPSVARYALSLPLGTKVSKVENLAPTLALGLGVDSNAIRVDNIPGTTYLGVEVPRRNRDFVQIRELMEQIEQASKGNLLATFGKDIDGSGIIEDLQKMPHLLIAGATGSGKSVLTNSFIISLLMRKTPDELKLILVDPKQVELSDYNGIPHLLTPVITEMDKVVNALKWAVDEMERRYTTLANNQVRNLEEYNKKMGYAAMPYIVVVIDEMADMMMTSNRGEAENAIVRLTQKARAVGIHLLLATQRPSVNVITGLIKANVPARIGMSVTSGVDSRVILDGNGAESLMGKGDMLVRIPGEKLMRLQGPSITSEEIQRVVNFIKSQTPEVEYVTSILESKSEGSAEGETEGMSGDDVFTDAIRMVVTYQKGSASFLQRKLGVGFNRAARLLDEMEESGVVGPSQGSKPREVLISDAEEFLQSRQNQ